MTAWMHMHNLPTIRALFDGACDLPEPEQIAWLEQNCADLDTRRDVIALLKQDRENQLSRAPVQKLPTAAFGPYRAVARIGSGGTSTVYRAVRTSGQFQQTVAIKVIAPFFSSSDFKKRLDTERQLLASLDHPNIAHLLDADTSSEGDPYLALQHVEGERLDTYCDARKLTIEERLRLFLQITDAVAYAHKKGIVHRDLKPANILVTAAGQVKLLDFGTGALLSEAADATVTRSRMVTPRYASPERLRGEPANAANDVFSLGVILYELLTGAWPFGAAPAADEWKRSITESSPLAPAAVVAEDAAARRSSSVTQLRRALVGDLSAIVGKALEDDPRRRYATVERLSSDIVAHLEGRSITARPRTLLYKSSKLLRRYWLYGAALACIAALVGYIILRPGSAKSNPASLALLRRSENAETKNPEAKDLYLKGRYYWNKRTGDGLAKAIDYFTQAVARDPNYAQAYAGLADSYNLIREYTSVPDSEAYPKASAAAAQALQLDERLPEAHAALAFASFWGAWNVTLANREFQRALALNPNYVDAHHWYATALMAMGHMRDALQEIERARELDPTSNTILADKGLILYYAGRPLDAIVLLKQLEATEPSFASSHRYLAAISLWEKDYATYIGEARLTAVATKDAASLTVAKAASKGFAAAGVRGLLREKRRAEEMLYAGGRWPAYSLAATCALLSDTGAALQYLEASYRKRESAFLTIAVDHNFDNLHGDPAYQELVRKVAPPAALR